MIHVICGMMGSGKSTYASKHYKNVCELEKYGSKKIQLEQAKKIHEEGKTVAYVTCYPTQQEMDYFESLSPEQVQWILIDTDFTQCKKNIQKRGRKSDKDVLETRFEKNRKLLGLIAKSKIRFKKIKVFETDEKW